MTLKQQQERNNKNTRGKPLRKDAEKINISANCRDAENALAWVKMVNRGEERNGKVKWPNNEKILKQ